MARLLAQGRGSVTRGAGIKTRKHDPHHTDLEIDLEGAGAELAFCKLMNVWPDLDTHSFGKFDCVSRTGNLVDIKSTRHLNGRLLAAPWKHKNNTDVYVLMIGEFPEYRCAGFLQASELFEKHHTQEIHGKKVQAAPQSALQAIEELDKLLIE